MVLSSIGSLSETAATGSTEPGGIQERHPSLPHGWQGPPAAVFPRHWISSGVACVEPAAIWDAGAAGVSFTHQAT